MQDSRNRLPESGGAATITRAQTRAALVESIEHWRRNENATTAKEVSLGPDARALCSLFLNEDADWKELCAGCPVSSHVHHRGCQKTPYDGVQELHIRWSCGVRIDDRDAFHAAAKAEREFLEMLLAKHDAEESGQ